MLVVKLELWPLGDEGAAREIGRATIGNIGGTSDRGDYAYEVTKDGETVQQGEFRGFARRERDAWDLVFLVLRAVVGVRNP